MRERLPSSSRIRAALDDLLKTVKEQDLKPWGWPPLLAWLWEASYGAVKKLDRDIALVTKHSKAVNASQVADFLSARPGKARAWYGGFFDTWAKATFLRSGRATEIDVPLPLGKRNSDLRVQLNGRSIRFECTVLTEDDEASDILQRFTNEKKTNPAAILRRPGPYCPPEAKGPSPYYNALRLYAKVYDKLALDLNPKASQFAEHEPNALLISFAGPGVRPSAPGISWALDELFGGQSKKTRKLPKELRDISLDAWMEHHAAELMKKGKLSADSYRARHDRLIAAPRRLAAIFLFKRCQLTNSRLNGNASAECAITKTEMAKLETLLRNALPYGP
jgi:hypothetical protein